jgi:hypothetical protein
MRWGRSFGLSRVGGGFAAASELPDETRRTIIFVDGNKRAARLELVTFVSLNDIDFVASESEADVMMLGLALGDIVEERLTRWIRGNWPEGA